MVLSLASIYRLKTLSLVGCLFLGLMACSKQELPLPPAQPTINGELLTFPKEQDLKEIHVAQVLAADNQEISVPGHLTWNEDQTSRIFAPYSGRVERVNIELGDRVNVGSLLADISSPDVGQAQADWAKAQADIRLLQSSVERTQALVSAGVMARKELDQIQADLERSQAEGLRAQARLNQYGVIPVSEKNNMLSAQQLHLKSPIKGVVVERNLNPGSEVRADTQGSPLIIVSNPATLWVVLDMDETQLYLIKPGLKFNFTTAAWPDQSFEGVVDSVSQKVDPESRKIQVKAKVDNAKALLKANMFINAHIPHNGGLPLLPAEAVVFRGEHTSVFVPREQGRYERKTVKLRQAGTRYWQVVDGLKAGDEVVIGGAIFLNQLLESSAK